MAKLVARIKKNAKIIEMHRCGEYDDIVTAGRIIVRIYRYEDRIDILGQNSGPLYREFFPERYRRFLRRCREARIERRRAAVRSRICRAGYQIIADDDSDDGFDAPLYRFRLVPGVFFRVYDTGEVEIGIAHPHFLLPADWRRYKRLHQLLSPFLPPQKRWSAKPEPVEPPQLGIDANGYPIPLPGTDAILALGPAPAPKAWENPKTLRHMQNRLRSLGYRISSVRWFGGQWRINLETGQTVYYREGGQISLGAFERDYRLERLFQIDGPQDQVARPLLR